MSHQPNHNRRMLVHLDITLLRRRQYERKYYQIIITLSVELHIAVIIGHIPVTMSYTTCHDACYLHIGRAGLLSRQYATMRVFIMKKKEMAIES